MSDIHIRYVPERNPSGAFVPGVPLRDLTRDEFDHLPGWARASVLAQDYYEPVDRPRRRSGPAEIKEHRDG